MNFQQEKNETSLKNKVEKNKEHCMHLCIMLGQVIELCQNNSYMHYLNNSGINKQMHFYK